jgi:hypothetical protein
VSSDSGTGSLVATDEHPFWVDSENKWVHAEDLKPGYTFTTADGRPATVTGTRSFSKVQLVYNLTVDGIHTYFIGAGAANVLTHNSAPNCPTEGPIYSERDSQGRVGPAYVEITEQVLDDAAAGLIGSKAGRGSRYAPAGFGGEQAGHSRGHLIGKQFGGDGRNLDNLVTQSITANNGAISTAEDMIAARVRSSRSRVIMSVTPVYRGGGVVPSHIKIEAVGDDGWSWKDTFNNL